jgi:hypothetical protein
MEEAKKLPERLDALGEQIGHPIPVTWFVRVDSQIEALLGCPVGLLSQFEEFWISCSKRGDELAWHPHLSCRAKAVCGPGPGSDSEASDELERLWEIARRTAVQPFSFRNGEAWHTAATYATIERLGFRCDSTVIPGRQGGGECAADWTAAPNHPYFPAGDNLCRSGLERPLLEIPMNGWRTQASYDRQPRVRYLNPDVHEVVFAQALSWWCDSLRYSAQPLNVWTLVMHPEEFMPQERTDALHAHSLDACCRNLLNLANRLTDLGHAFEFVTMAAASEFWRREQQAHRSNHVPSGEPHSSPVTSTLGR